MVSVFVLPKRPLYRSSSVLYDFRANLPNDVLRNTEVDTWLDVRIFSEHYRIHMDIGNSKNYLGTIYHLVSYMWHLVQILHRLVPLQRGLFEDYVANFWCASHIVIKWKRILSQGTLVRLCTGLTALAFAPACVHQVMRPSRLGFLYCLLNSSLSFFLFSYQVRANHAPHL